MLKKLLQNKRFRRIVDDALSENNLLDIILFGSVVRGKDEPRDIDFIFLYAFKEDKEYSYELKKKFEKAGFKAHILGMNYSGLLEPSFLAREGVLLEGYSFRNKQFLSSAFGFSSFVLFRYTLKGMNNSKRMKFYYSLYGRRSVIGVLETFRSYKFSDNLIVSPIEQADNIKGFFESNGIRFDIINVLLPTRISSRKFLEFT